MLFCLVYYLSLFCRWMFFFILFVLKSLLSLPLIPSEMFLDAKNLYKPPYFFWSAFHSSSISSAIFRLPSCTCTFACLSVCPFMSICIHVYLYPCLSVSLSICIQVYLYPCLSVSMSICIHVYLFPISGCQFRCLS